MDKIETTLTSVYGIWSCLKKKKSQLPGQQEPLKGPTKGLWLAIRPSAGIKIRITEFLYWIETSLSPQSQRKCLKLLFEIKSDKLKSLGNNFYK